MHHMMYNSGGSCHRRTQANTPHNVDRRIRHCNSCSPMHSSFLSHFDISPQSTLCSFVQIPCLCPFDRFQQGNQCSCRSQSPQIPFGTYQVGMADTQTRTEPRKLIGRYRACTMSMCLQIGLQRLLNMLRADTVNNWSGRHPQHCCMCRHRSSRTNTSSSFPFLSDTSRPHKDCRT